MAEPHTQPEKPEPEDGPPPEGQSETECKALPPLPEPYSLLALGAALILGLVVQHREVAQFWHQPRTVATKEIPFAEIDAAPEFIQVRGFERGEDGYYLAPQARGQYLFRINIDPPRPIDVEPVFYNVSSGGRFRNQFQYSVDGGQNWVTAWENRTSLRSQSVLIPAARALFVVLRFDAVNTTSERALVLQGIRLRAGVEADVVPQVSGVLYAAAIALLVFQLGVAGGLPRAACLLAGLVASGAGLWLGLLQALFCVLLLVVLGAKLLRRCALTWTVVEVPALLFILAFGLEARENRLQEYAHAPLTGDAVGYQQIAEEMTLFSWGQGFYAPRWREPMHPLMGKLFSAVCQRSDFHHRLMTVCAGMCAIALAWWVGRHALHPACGLVAAGLMAGDNYLIFRSMYGYRLEVRTCLLLVFVYLLVVCRAGRLVWRSALAGLAGALLALTELSTLPLVIFFIGWHLVTHRDQWRPAAAAAIVALLVLLPFFGRQIAEHGDPLYPLSKHAKWYRNVEAQRNVGEPGYPSADEIADYSGYEGPPVSLMGYLFGSHTFGELAAGTARGYVRYLSGEPFFREWILRLLFVAGLLILLIQPGRRVLGLVLLLTNMPPAMFLYGAGLLTEERVLLHVFPFAAMCVALPFLSTVQRLSRKTRLA